MQRARQKRFARGFRPEERALTLTERLYPPRRPRTGKGSGRAGGGRGATHAVDHYLGSWSGVKGEPSVFDSFFTVPGNITSEECLWCRYDKKLWSWWLEWKVIRNISPLAEAHAPFDKYLSYWVGKPQMCDQCTKIKFGRVRLTGYLQGGRECECLKIRRTRNLEMTPERAEFEVLAAIWEERLSCKKPLEAGECSARG